jgi:hypothetical protein
VVFRLTRIIKNVVPLLADDKARYVSVMMPYRLSVYVTERRKRDDPRMNFVLIRRHDGTQGSHSRDTIDD